jgi:hypothetical protein
MAQRVDLAVTEAGEIDTVAAVKQVVAWAAIE